MIGGVETFGGITGTVWDGGLLGTNIDRGGLTCLGGTTGIGSRSMRTSLGFWERFVDGLASLGAVTEAIVRGIRSEVGFVTGCGTSGNGSMKMLLLDGAKAVGGVLGRLKLG